MARPDNRTRSSEPEPFQARFKGRPPEKGEPITEQTAFEFNTPIAWICELYRITREVAEEHFGQDALAADIGVSRQLIGRRLSRKQNDRGEIEKLHLDVVGHLWHDPVARWDWIKRANLACGAKEPEPLMPPSEAQCVKALAREVPEHRRRQMEKENGWPNGWLDR